MFINLNMITEQGIIINQDITFDESYYKNTIIKGIKEAKVEGKIYYSTTKEVIFDGTVKGIMQIIDSNTADVVDYPFESNIEEILAEDTQLDEELRTKDKNSLDLIDILWQNIVLEVPLKFSTSDVPLLNKGDGWELRNEEDNKIDPRLEPLKALLDSGKE